MSELETRFAYILDISNNKFAPVHMLATFFDPEFLIGLSPLQCTKCIEIVVGELTKGDQKLDTSTAASAMTSKNVELFQKKFSGFFKQAQMPQMVRSEGASKSDHSKSLKSKLEQYVDEVTGTAACPEGDAVKFWTAKRVTFGEIAKYALNILSVPASSAGIERIFSLASIVQGGQRRRLGAENTEKELMIKVNSEYFIQK